MDYLNTAEVTRFALIFLSIIVMVISYWVGTQALFPEFTRKAQNAYSRPWIAAVVGLAVLLVVSLLMGVMAKIQHGLQFVAGLLGLVLLVLALAGSAGLARRIGSGLQAPADKDQPWRRTLRGSLVLGGLMLVPLAGAVPLGAFLITGLGVSVLTLNQRRQEKALEAREDYLSSSGDV
jgi:hypothetical protein